MVMYVKADVDHVAYAIMVAYPDDAPCGLRRCRLAPAREATKPKKAGPLWLGLFWAGCAV
jgi:hypothetical protein